MNIRDPFEQIADQLGLSAQQRSGLLGWFDGQVEAVQAERRTQLEAELAELKADLGPRFEGFIAEARERAQALGLDEGGFMEMMATVGPATAAQMFASGSTGTGTEPSRVDLGADGLSEAQARERIDQAMADGGFMKELEAGNASVAAAWDKWHNVAYPEPVEAKEPAAPREPTPLESLQSKMMDSDFMGRVERGDPVARIEWDNLHATAYSEG